MPDKKDFGSLRFSAVKFAKSVSFHASEKHGLISEQMH